MKKCFIVMLAFFLLSGILFASAYAAEFSPVFPKQGAKMVEPPNLTWAAGEYDLFRLVLVLPFPTGYRVIPLWSVRPFFPLPDWWWDYVDIDGWGFWMVIGLNTTTRDYEITSWQYFQKVYDCVVEFPDANLDAFIRDQIHKPTGDIMASDLRGVWFMFAGSSSISDLSGLEYLTDLYVLELGGNSISEISPLGNLTKLSCLTLGRDWISDVSPLAGITDLTTLDLYENLVRDIRPLATLTNLTELHLFGNIIEEIDALAGMTHLTQLELQDNQIQDILPLVENPGMDAGDLVWLPNNPLNAVSCSDYIPELKSRGVLVVESCR